MQTKIIFVFEKNVAIVYFAAAAGAAVEIFLDQEAAENHTQGEIPAVLGNTGTR